MDGDSAVDFGAMVISAARAAIDGLDSERCSQLLGALPTLVRAQRWPVRTPTLAELHAAPAALAVAWDSVCDARTEQSIAELLEAHARAERLGLDWSDTVQRAVVERVTDEVPIGMLLATR